MKQKKRLIICVCLFLMSPYLVPFTQIAIAETNEKSFSGKISVGTGVIRCKNNGLAAESGGKETTGSAAIWDGLNSSATKKETEIFPIAEFELGYSFFNTGTTIFGGGSVFGDDIYLGFHQYLAELGNLSLTGSASKELVWKDPYLIGVKRINTNKITREVELIYDSILNSGAEITLGMNEIDIKNDDVGTRFTNLRRDGVESELKVAYVFNISKTNMFKPVASLFQSDINGKANSSSGFTCGFLHSIEKGRLSFQTDFLALKSTFDDVHPVFNKKREDIVFTLDHEIVYNDFFGLKNWSMSGFALLGKTDSNINFFDDYFVAGGTKVSYHF